MQKRISLNAFECGLFLDSPAMKDSKKRSSPPEVFLLKGVLKKCSKFIGEHPCQSVISIKFKQL